MTTVHEGLLTVFNRELTKLHEKSNALTESALALERKAQNLADEAKEEKNQEAMKDLDAGIYTFSTAWKLVSTMAKAELMGSEAYNLDESMKILDKKITALELLIQEATKYKDNILTSTLYDTIFNDAEKAYKNKFYKEIKCSPTIRDDLEVHIKKGIHLAASSVSVTIQKLDEKIMRHRKTESQKIKEGYPKNSIGAIALTEFDKKLYLLTEERDTLKKEFEKHERDILQKDRELADTRGWMNKQNAILLFSSVSAAETADHIASSNRQREKLAKAFNTQITDYRKKMEGLTKEITAFQALKNEAEICKNAPFSTANFEKLVDDADLKYQQMIYPNIIVGAPTMLEDLEQGIHHGLAVLKKIHEHSPSSIPNWLSKLFNTEASPAVLEEKNEMYSQPNSMN
ncbi:MAG: hypothetical protein SFW66_04285 [Gammaproteobacteria bacterium]|nr:hypothetical protein [Gammaproteobacteria bacterium]